MKTSDYIRQMNYGQGYNNQKQFRIVQTQNLASQQETKKGFAQYGEVHRSTQNIETRNNISRMTNVLPNINTANKMKNIAYMKNTTTFSSSQLTVNRNPKPLALRSQPLARRSQLSIVHCALLIIVCLMISGKAWGQDNQPVTVGDGTSATSYGALHSFYTNSYTQTIYSSSAINHSSGYISKIAFYSGAAYTWECNATIYMANVSKETFTSSSDWVASSNFTEVGTIEKIGTANSNCASGGSTGWFEITLNEPYYYETGKSLVVAISATSTRYCTSETFQYTSVSNTCLTRGNDSNTSYADYPGTNTGTQRAYRLNIQLYFDSSSGSGGCEDFESYSSSANNNISNSSGTVPSGWGVSGNTGNYRPHFYNGSYSKDGVGIVFTSGSSSYGGNSSYLYSNITLHEGEQVSFNTYTEGSATTTRKMYYGYWKNSAFQSLGEATTIQYSSVTDAATQGLTTFTVPAEANGYNLAWYWYNSSSFWSAVIDNVCVTTASSYTLSWSTPTGGTISVTQGGSSVSSGSVVSGTVNITATPSSGYVFSGWSVTGGATLGSSSTASTTLTMGAANATLTATFTRTYTLSWSNPTGGTISVTQGGNSVSSGSSFIAGTSLNITATPASGYIFNGWTFSGTGATIASAIAHTRGLVTTIAEGLCASAASLIWSAGRTCEVGDYAMFMYHMSSHADMNNSLYIAESARQMVHYVQNCLMRNALKHGHITPEEHVKFCENKEEVWISADEMRRRIAAHKEDDHGN